MIGSLCIIIRRPKGEEVSTSGIRTAWASYTSALDSSILLIEDGVFNGLNNPGYNTELLRDFISQNGKAYCYRKDMMERGLTESDLLDGIEVIEEERVAEIVSESDGTLTF
jgi:sulfur relay protein TusB/DsrH